MQRGSSQSHGMRTCAHLGCSCCEREEFGTKQQARVHGGQLEIGRPRATRTRRQPGRLLPHEAGRLVDAAVAGELGHCRARLPAWKALLKGRAARKWQINPNPIWHSGLASRLSYAPAPSRPCRLVDAWPGPQGVSQPARDTPKKRHLVEVLVKVNLGVYFLLIKNPPSSNSSRLIEFFELFFSFQK